MLCLVGWNLGFQHFQQPFLLLLNNFFPRFKHLSNVRPDERIVEASQGINSLFSESFVNGMSTTVFIDASCCSHLC
jgi:hypothetical protein